MVGTRMQQHTLPVYVSIATIPSRIGKMKPTIDSLLGGSRVPDKIFVVHPQYCKWEQAGYEVPDFLRDTSYNGGIVEHVVAADDWGSSTKILGVLDKLDVNCYLVIVDDDVIYDQSFLAGLVEAQSMDHASTFAYHSYRADGMNFATGCDGVSFYSPNLSGLQAFADQHVIGTKLLYHDDLWIGFYLFKNGVPLKKVPRGEDGRLIYTQVLPNDALSAPISRDLAREIIQKESIARLLKTGGLSKAQLLRVRATRAFDFVAGKLRAIPRRLRRQR